MQIMTFLKKYGPAPCDKKCHSEQQALFPLLGEGLETRLWLYGTQYESSWGEPAWSSHYVRHSLSCFDRCSTAGTVTSGGHASLGNHGLDDV